MRDQGHRVSSKDALKKKTLISKPECSSFIWSILWLRSILLPSLSFLPLSVGQKSTVAFSFSLVRASRRHFAWKWGFAARASKRPNSLTSRQQTGFFPRELAHHFLPLLFFVMLSHWTTTVTRVTLPDNARAIQYYILALSRDLSYSCLRHKYFFFSPLIDFPRNCQVLCVCFGFEAIVKLLMSLNLAAVIRLFSLY